MRESIKSLVVSLILIVGIGFVDLVDNGVASVQFYGPSGTMLSDHVALVNIPCKVREGDIIYALKVKGATVYRCVSIKK